MKPHFPPLPLTSIHCSAWVNGHHAWGHVVALASMFPLWDPDGQRDRLTMWLPPPPPFPPPPYRLSLSVTVWEASWFLTVVQTGWVGSLISYVIFIGGLQPLLQILKLNLFHLRPGGIHLSVVLRLLTCHTCSTWRVCQCLLWDVYNIYNCGLYGPRHCQVEETVVFQANRDVFGKRMWLWVMSQPPQESTVKLVSLLFDRHRTYLNL